MKEWQTKFKEWWATLVPREKNVASAGAIIVGLFVLYFFIWNPYLSRVAALRTRIQVDQKTLVWMQAADKQMTQIEGQARDKNQSISPVLLLGLLQKQVTQAGLQASLSELKQASSESIEMHFKKVEFDRLVKFLTTVVKSSRVVISQMSVTADSTQGVVNADIVLGML